MGICINYTAFTVIQRIIIDTKEYKKPILDILDNTNHHHYRIPKYQHMHIETIDHTNHIESNSTYQLVFLLLVFTCQLLADTTFDNLDVDIYI